MSTLVQAETATEGSLNGMVPKTKRKVSELFLGHTGTCPGGRALPPATSRAARGLVNSRPSVPCSEGRAGGSGCPQS